MLWRWLPPSWPRRIEGFEGGRDMTVHAVHDGHWWWWRRRQRKKWIQIPVKLRGKHLELRQKPNWMPQKLSSTRSWPRSGCSWSGWRIIEFSGFSLFCSLFPTVLATGTLGVYSWIFCLSDLKTSRNKGIKGRMVRIFRTRKVAELDAELAKAQAVMNQLKDWFFWRGAAGLVLRRREW